MKLYAIIISAFLTFQSYGQIDYIEQDSLIIKHKVKSIKIITHWDDGTWENTELWKYDLSGRLTYESLVPDEDSITDETYYFYTNNLLTETRHLGVWEYRTRRVDTEYVFLSYDKLNCLISEKSYSTNGNDTFNITYEYENKKPIKRISGSNKYGQFKSISTISYFSDGKIRTRKNSEFQWDTLEVFTETEYFDSSGVLQTITRSDYSDNCKQVRSIKSFIYTRSGQLERIKESQFYDYPWPTEFSFFERRFYYNQKGLLDKEERYFHGKLKNFDKFEYEYYNKPKTSIKKNNR